MSWLGRIFKQATPSPFPAGGGAGKRTSGPNRPNRMPTSASNEEETQKIRGPISDWVELELGDFYQQLPTELLKQGTPDLKRALKFKSSDIMALIAIGKETIPLSKIAAQLPDLFLAPITNDNDVEISFPWNKVEHLVALSETLRNRVIQTTPVYEPLFANRVVAEPRVSAAASFSQAVLSSSAPVAGESSDQTVGQTSFSAAIQAPAGSERAALHARKRAWFRGNADAEKETTAPSSPTLESLQKDIESLRAELAQVRKERDDALKALAEVKG